MRYFRRPRKPESLPRSTTGRSGKERRRRHYGRELTAKLGRSMAAPSASKCAKLAPRRSADAGGSDVQERDPLRRARARRPLGAPASAAEIKVMNSGGFTAAYKDLAPGCERTTGNTVATAWGASMGTAPDAIPMRLARGEPADVAHHGGAGARSDDHGRQGRARQPRRPRALVDRDGGAGRRAEARHLDRRGVDEGAPRGQSIAYSASASGVYCRARSCRAFPAATASWRRAARS